MKKILFIFSFSFFIFCTSYSQNGWIMQCPSPFIGRYVNSVDFKDINTGIVSGSNGIYMTTDGSLSWVQLNLPNNLGSFASYNNFGKWFLSSPGKYSTNDGITWIPYNGIIWSNVTFINPYIGTALSSLGEYAKTTDGGQNWTYCYGNLPLYNWPMSQQMVNDSTVYVGCDNGLLAYTTNGGLNFTGLWSGSYDNHFDQIKFLNSKTGYVCTESIQKIYKTTNGGFNWNDWNMILAGDSAGYFDFIDTNTGVISAQAGILLTTTNGGTNWNYKSLDSITRGKIKMFNKDTMIISGNCLYDGSFSLIRSTDFGNSFTYLNNAAINILYGINFLNESLGYSVGYNGKILKTTNGGINWIPIKNPYCSYLYSAISVFSTNPNNTYIVGNAGNIIRTTNGGKSWTRQVLGTTYNLLKIFFIDQNTGFIVGEKGAIFKTTNGGDVWFTTNANIKGNLWSVVMINSNTGFIAGDNALILKTTDGGSSWISKNSVVDSLTNYGLTSISFGDSKTGMAAGENGVILKTTNGGENWTRLKTNIGTKLYDISMYNNKLAVACGYKGKIIITTNGGDKWFTDNVDSNSTLWSIQFVDSAIAYACGVSLNPYETLSGVIYKKSLKNYITNTNIQNSSVPYEFGLFQNYPNPFNPSTNIKYQIANNKLVVLKIYDILGREIQTLVNEKKSPGTYEVTFDGSKLASGIYFYTLTVEDFKETKKFVLLK